MLSYWSIVHADVIGLHRLDCLPNVQNEQTGLLLYQTTALECNHTPQNDQPDFHRVRALVYVIRRRKPRYGEHP